MNKKTRRLKILDLARQFESEGDLELDDDAKISEGDDNGAYVQMWKWVSFSDTELCKGQGSSNEGKDGDHSQCGVGCPVFDKE